MTANASKYFVKFVPYNQSTISSLINNQVKFSKVYEFNDLHELGVIGTFDEEIHRDLVVNILNNIDYRVILLENFSYQGYVKAFVEKFISDIKSKTNKELSKISNYQSIFLEWAAYYFVGIFSLSDLSVFKDDAGMLMFAHYADNLTGLALIYEVREEAACKVEYVPACGIRTSGGDAERFNAWHNCSYQKNEMEDFLKKSQKWAYESEWRLFSKPGIASAEESGVRLRGILYTSRFEPSQMQVLVKINSKFYNDELFISELRPSFTDYTFKKNVIKEALVLDWLHETLGVKKL